MAAAITAVFSLRRLLLLPCQFPVRRSPFGGLNRGNPTPAPLRLRMADRAARPARSMHYEWRSLALLRCSRSIAAAADVHWLCCGGGWSGRSPLYTPPLLSLCRYTIYAGNGGTAVDIADNCVSDVVRRAFREVLCLPMQVLRSRAGHIADSGSGRESALMSYANLLT